jgi:hypothetical protein
MKFNNAGKKIKDKKYLTAGIVKNTYVVESWSIVYFKKEKHGELGGS